MINIYLVHRSTALYLAITITRYVLIVRFFTESMMRGTWYCCNCIYPQGAISRRRTYT